MCYKNGGRWRESTADDDDDVVDMKRDLKASWNGKSLHRPLILFIYMRWLMRAR